MSAHSLSDNTVVASPSRRHSSDVEEQVTFELKNPENAFSLPTQEPQITKSEETIAAASETAPAGTSPRPIHGWKWALVCVAIYLNAFTYGLDTTIAADVQSAVVQSLGEVQQISWLGTGFLLGSVATILIIGNLLDRFNGKWIFITGMFLFELGSLLCAVAHTMNALIVGRVIAGIGGSGIYMGGLNYFTGLTGDSERGTYIAGLGMFWGVGAVLGPVIGGAFAVSSATWRWAFYINLVLAALVAPVVLVFLPPLRPMQGHSILSRTKSIDWVGAFLNAAIWVFFVVVLTFAGSTWAWNDGRTIAFWVIIGALLIAFTLQQAFAIFTTKANRLFPAHLLKSRTQVLLYFAMAATSTALFTPIYYIPLYFQFVHGDTAILAAVRLLPFVVISMAINLAMGTLLPKIPHYALLYLITGLLTISGSAAMFTVTANTPQANVYGYSILIAIGAGATIQTGYTLAGVKAYKSGHPEDITPSIGFQNVAQIGSGAIALVISGQVFQSYALKNLNEVLAGQGFTQQEIAAAVAGAQSTVFQQISDELKARAIEAITDAISRVYILVIVAGVVSVLSAVSMRWERLF